MNEYLEKVKDPDYRDSITGRAPSEEAIKYAKQDKVYFKNIEIPRKEKLRKKEKLKSDKKNTNE